MKGYLTVFLSLSLTILLSLFFVLIRGAFVNYSKMKLEIVTDISLNAVLGEYHRELLNQYDLLFIDTSYGTSTGGLHRLENHLRGYIEENLKVEKGTVSAWNTLYLQNIDITETLNAHHYDGKILKRQACAYISDNIKAETLNDLSSLLTQAETLDNNNAMTSWRNVMNGIASLLSSLTNEARQRALKKDPEADVENINVSINNPATPVYHDADQKIEKLVSVDKKGENVNLNNYYSHRNVNKAAPPSGKYESNIIDELTSTILFNAYTFEKLGYYKNEKIDSLLDYQIEYLIVGANSDEKNLQGIKMRIFGWRFADNARLYFASTQKKAEANAIATTVCALIMNPQLTQLVANSLLFSWAFTDSIDDVNKIMDGGKIPLVKKAIGSAEGGLLYNQYLEILLSITREGNVLARVMDIIEMDIRLTPYNQNFRIDLCVEGLKVSAYFYDHYETYKITRLYSY